MHPAFRRQHLRQSCAALADGGVIAYPTEAVYGLGCRSENAAAVSRILRLKHRPANKRGLILVASSLAQVASYVDLRPVPDLAAILSTWPGAVSWVFPAGRGLPAGLRGAGHSIAIRISAHPLVRALCRMNGPLVSTQRQPQRQGARPQRRPSQALLRRALGLHLSRRHPRLGPTQRDPLRHQPPRVASGLGAAAGLARPLSAVCRFMASVGHVLVDLRSMRNYPRATFSHDWPLS